MMKCEAELCIYNRDNECICDVIDINSLGMCDGYMIVNLEQHFLAAEKVRQLGEIESRWNDRPNE